MYENMTVLSNKEYAELAIKAHKYDVLRSRALKSGFYTLIDDSIYNFTDEEVKAMEEKRREEIL